MLFLSLSPSLVNFPSLSLSLKLVKPFSIS